MRPTCPAPDSQYQNPKLFLNPNSSFPYYFFLRGFWLCGWLPWPSLMASPLRLSGDGLYCCLVNDLCTGVRFLCLGCISFIYAETLLSYSMRYMEWSWAWHLACLNRWFFCFVVHAFFSPLVRSSSLCLDSWSLGARSWITCVVLQVLSSVL